MTTRQIVIAVILIILLIVISILAFGKSTPADGTACASSAVPNNGIIKNGICVATSLTTNPNPTPVVCNPNRPGYTMNGDFSVQCAGGTTPCDPSKPGYDVKGNLQAYCGVPCDPNNPAYDVNGNFNMLCGGGVRRR